MASDDLLTRTELEALWGVGKDAVNARIRKFAKDVRKIKIGNSDAQAITRREAERIARECRESVIVGRQKSGATRSREVSKRRPSPGAVVSPPKVVALPVKRTSAKRRSSGWKEGNSALFLPKVAAPAEPALPPCEPTIRGIMARYHVSEKTIRGWIIDNLLRFDADGYVDGPSMARVARCYQPRRASRWMERTLAEYGEV